MDTVTFAEQGPTLAAVLAFAIAVIRYLHVHSTKTRELIEKSSRENRELIEAVRRENRELIRENRELIEKSSRENQELIRENRELIDKNHRELTSSLLEVRERLAHIEGYLRQSPPPCDGGAIAA